MYPVTFDQQNKVLNPAKGTEDKVIPLNVFTDGEHCTSCWALDDAEFEEVAKTRRVWVSVMSGGTQPPVLPSATKPIHVTTYAEGWREVMYREPKSPNRWERVFMYCDAPAPIECRIGDVEMFFDKRWTPCKRYRDLEPNDWYFRVPSDIEIEKRIDVAKKILETENNDENSFLFIFDKCKNDLVLCRVIEVNKETNIITEEAFL